MKHKILANLLDLIYYGLYNELVKIEFVYSFNIYVFTLNFMVYYYYIRLVVSISLAYKIPKDYLKIFL